MLRSSSDTYFGDREIWVGIQLFNFLAVGSWASHLSL